MTLAHLWIAVTFPGPRQSPGKWINNIAQQENVSGVRWRHYWVMSRSLLVYIHFCKDQKYQLTGSSTDALQMSANSLEAASNVVKLYHPRRCAAGNLVNRAALFLAIWRRRSYISVIYKKITTIACEWDLLIVFWWQPVLMSPLQWISSISRSFFVVIIRVLVQSTQRMGTIKRDLEMLTVTEEEA